MIITRKAKALQTNLLRRGIRLEMFCRALFNAGTASMTQNEVSFHVKRAHITSTEPSNDLTHHEKIDRFFEFEMPEEEADDNSGFLYFIGINEYVKVGITTDLQQRLSCIQTGSPYEVKLLNHVFVGGNVRDVETSIHAYLKQEGKHVRGEWFNLNMDEIYDLIDSI